MNIEIIQFICFPSGNCDDTDFPTIVFRSALPESAMDDRGDAACHYTEAGEI